MPANNSVQMAAYVCVACGMQYEPSEQPPSRCAICEEERQFVPPVGQRWTTISELARSHKVTFADDGGLLGIGTAPAIGIGQRALLIRRPSGNILWDCVSLINQTVVDIINGLGGLDAIAISHPHYYSNMVEWSRAFGGIPIYVHRSDEAWVMRRHSTLQLWEGETRTIAEGVTLIRVGGHFEGGTVLHWGQGGSGAGAVLSGDLLQVTADRKFVSFMRSFPNYLPLGRSAVAKILSRLNSFEFEVIYGAFWDRVIQVAGKQVLIDSARRHIDWLERD